MQKCKQYFTIKAEMLFREFTQGLYHLFQRLPQRSSKDPWEEIGKELRDHLLNMDTLPEVADRLTKRIVEKARSSSTLSQAQPSQLILQCLKEEIEAILGEAPPLKRTPHPFRFLLVGLQGSGKTTTAQKLGTFLKKEGEKILLVPLDLRRPQAVEQLKILGENAGLPVFTPPYSEVIPSARSALKELERGGYTGAIFDTAGRHTLEDDLLKELRELTRLLDPQEILYVLDSSQGQSAYPVVEGFRTYLSLTGILLSKVDLDPKGGAVLSVRFKTRLPIKGMGIGEHPEDFRSFSPSWISSQLLDLGDIEGLLEKLNEHIADQTARAMEERFLKGRIHLEDLLRQLELMNQIGPWEKLLSFLPGGKALSSVIPSSSEQMKESARMIAIIRSMTKEERLKPQILNHRRILRIARGSGTDPGSVRRLLKRFEQLKKLTRRMGNLSPEELFRSPLSGNLPFLPPNRGKRG